MFYVVCTVLSTMDDEIQHQIPQQISAYQFRLVGDMTLQQFFQIAGGAVIALIVYSSGLPGYIKWPIVLVSFLTGVAFAFFPLQDRPLQKWMVLFIKAIYSPTIFVWKQNPNTPQFFQQEDTDLPIQQNFSQQTITTAPAGTSDPAATSIPKLEEKEQQILSSILQVGTSQADTIKIEPKEIEPQQLPQTQNEIEVPLTEQVEIEKQELEVQPLPSKPVEDTTKPDITPLTAQPSTGIAKQAQFNQDAGPPIPPTQPNVIVGQVLGPNGEIVENAILEIKDTEGRPVRALKSNKLGHFMIVTSLSNGKYEITTEKEELEFDKITFEAKGDVIPPIAIWANKNTSQVDAANEQNAENTNDNSNTEKTIYNQGEKQ